MITVVPSTIKTDPAALAEISRRVHAAHDRGEKRIGVRKIMEQVRADLKVSVNNNDQTQITDYLIAECPALADKITTRARGTRGKNKTARTDLAKIVALLEQRPGLTIEAIQVSAGGKSATIPLAALASLLAA